MIRILIASAAIAMSAFAAQAADPTEPHVVARTQDMKMIGGNVKKLGGMAKGSIAFDAAEAQAAAAAIAEGAAEIPVLFETEADDPASEALPIIWEQYDDFTSKAKALEDAALAASQSIESQDDLGPVMAQLGGTCKACHSTFRE